MITGVVRPSVTTTTATNAMVRRLWNERGTDGLGGRTSQRRGSPPGGSTVDVPGETSLGKASELPDERRPATSALGELVAGAPDRQHEAGQRRVVLDLLAQVADMDVDRLLVLVERLVVPEELQQLAAAEHPPRPAGQVAQDLELRGRER